MTAFLDKAAFRHHAPKEMHDSGNFVDWHGKTYTRLPDQQQDGNQ